MRVLNALVGAAGFGGGWNDKLIAKFSSLINVQDTYMNVFYNFAMDAEKDFYNKKIQDPSFKDVKKLREKAFSMAKSFYLGETVDAGHWFRTITKKINILKQIENHLAEGVKGLAYKEAKTYGIFTQYLFVGYCHYNIACGNFNNICFERLDQKHQ